MLTGIELACIGHEQCTLEVGCGREENGGHFLEGPPTTKSLFGVVVVFKYHMPVVLS